MRQTWDLTKLAAYKRAESSNRSIMVRRFPHRPAAARGR
jgi:hypothetical protein